MFAEHPVRVPIAGTVESIGEITAQTLYDCHRAFYDPSNMTLCVVGDVDPSRVVQIAQEILPPTPGGVSARNYGAAEPRAVAKPYISRTMDVSMPMFMLGFKCDPTEPGREALRRALLADLAAELLMGESSPLYNRLYEEGLIDAGFSCGYETVKSACILSASGDSRDPEAVRDAILEEAARLVREGADEALFERLKKSEFGRRLRELDSFEAICYRMAETCFDGAEYYDFPDLYDTLSVEQAVDFLREAITPERMTLAVILPRGKEETA
jgi:predicted Zn-dependent peptidase